MGQQAINRAYAREHTRATLRSLFHMDELRTTHAF